jgi:hypothetical protein
MLDERFSLFATAEHEFSHRSAAFVYSSQIHFGREMFVMNHRLDLLGVRNIMERVGVQKHKVSGLAHIDRSTSWGAPTALAPSRKAACSASSGVNPRRPETAVLRGGRPRLPVPRSGPVSVVLRIGSVRRGQHLDKRCCKNGSPPSLRRASTRGIFMTSELVFANCSAGSNT